MRILHVIQGLNAELGGLMSSVAAWGTLQAARGNEVHVWGMASQSGTADFGTALVTRTFPRDWPALLGGSAAMAAALERLEPPPDVVHLHGLWLMVHRQMAAAARRRGIPHAVTIHGMLEPYAWSLSPVRKRLAWRVYQRAILERAAGLHVTTESERRTLAAFGLAGRARVIPIPLDKPLRHDSSNRDGPPTWPHSSESRLGEAVNLSRPTLPASAERSRIKANSLVTATPTGSPTQTARAHGELCQAGVFRSRFPELAAKRVLLFLGRIHRIKGLERFARAWSLVSQEFPEWQWVVAGPDGGLRARLERLLQGLGTADRVTFTGPLSGASKDAALAAAEVLVLPSEMESFGAVVLEALARGTPALCSTGCPWSAAAEAGCVALVPNCVDDWCEALRNALSQPVEVLAARGRRGQRWVAERFDPETIADEWERFYGELRRSRQSGSTMANSTADAVQRLQSESGHISPRMGRWSHQ